MSSARLIFQECEVEYGQESEAGLGRGAIPVSIPTISKPTRNLRTVNREYFPNRVVIQRICSQRVHATIPFEHVGL